MAQSIKAIRGIRGMNDILPEEIALWQHVEHQLLSLANRFGYREIRFPVVEKTQLFTRSIGEVTDIVEKEMYTFTDRHGDSLSLRPEGTASCVRTVLEHGLLHQQPTQRLWYMGPMYRYERPQKGRYRQFHHFGLEVFGFSTPDIEAEVLAFGAQLWKSMGLEDSLSLQLNCLGTGAVRQRYREALVSYFSDQHDSLDEDSQKRLHTNPLRILDSKNPEMQSLIDEAPIIFEYLDESSREHFEQLKQILDSLGIKYTFNPRLVRGLDYYTSTVFEWQTDQLGAQNAVCAGGRYDGLVEELGGRATPAVGFALGMERLIALLQQAEKQAQPFPIDVYVLGAGDQLDAQIAKTSQKLRQALPHLAIMQHCGGGSFKSQFKKADKSGAQWAVILGEAELQQQQYGLKNLREHTEQAQYSWAELISRLQQEGN